MLANIKPFSGALKWIRGILAVMTLLLLASCGLSPLGAGGDDLKETSIALGVQSTTNALREATLQAMETNQAQFTATPAVQVNLQATLDVQLTTIAQQATAAAPTVAVMTPTPEAAAPTEPTVLEDILLQKWETLNLTSSTNCNDREGLPCWVGSGYDIALETTEPILIDTNWQRPYLLFSHTYTFEADAYLYVNTGGRWEILWSYPKGEVRWTEVAIDLSKFKGKEILLKYSVSGPTTKSGGVWWKSSKSMPKSRWSLLNIRLAPNYTK